MSQSIAGWVLYDGECTFCRRWVSRWQPILQRHRFEIKTLQQAAADSTVSIPKEHLLDDIRLLTDEGTLIAGADAYLYVTRHVWWAWPFYWVFQLQGFRSLMEWGYRRFARNRYCVFRPRVAHDQRA